MFLKMWSLCWREWQAFKQEELTLMAKLRQRTGSSASHSPHPVQHLRWERKRDTKTLARNSWGTSSNWVAMPVNERGIPNTYWQEGAQSWSSPTWNRTQPQWVIPSLRTLLASFPTSPEVQTPTWCLRFFFTGSGWLLCPTWDLKVK